MIDNLPIELILEILSYIHVMDINGYTNMNIYNYIKHNIKSTHNNLKKLLNLSLINGYIYNIITNNAIKVIVFPKQIINNILTKYKPTYIFAPLDCTYYNLKVIKEYIKGLYIPYNKNLFLSNISSCEKLKYIDIFKLSNTSAIQSGNITLNLNPNTIISCVSYNQINTLVYQRVFHKFINDKHVHQMKNITLINNNNNQLYSLKFIPYHKIFRDLKIKSDIYEEEDDVNIISSLESYGILIFKSYDTQSNIINNNYVTNIDMRNIPGDTLEYIYHPNIDNIKKVTLVIGSSVIYKMNPVQNTIKTIYNNLYKVITLGKYGIPKCLLMYHDIDIILESDIDLNNNVKFVVGKFTIDMKNYLINNNINEPIGFDLFPGLYMRVMQGMGGKAFINNNIELYMSGNMSPNMSQIFDNIHAETYNRMIL